MIGILLQLEIEFEIFYEYIGPGIFISHLRPKAMAAIANCLKIIKML